MTLRAAVLSALLAMCADHGLAQNATLTDTPGCRAALSALDARAAERAPKTELEALRRRAALACLGSAAASAPPQAARAQPPQAVSPMAPRSAAVPAAPPPLPRPIPPSAPPLSLGACDATGCWASDGTRMSRAGTGQLLGPRGLCSVQGTLIHCPP